MSCELDIVPIQQLAEFQLVYQTLSDELYILSSGAHIKRKGRLTSTYTQGSRFVITGETERLSRKPQPCIACITRVGSQPLNHFSNSAYLYGNGVTATSSRIASRFFSYLGSCMWSFNVKFSQAK